MNEDYDLIVIGAGMAGVPFSPSRVLWIRFGIEPARTSPSSE